MNVILSKKSKKMLFYREDQEAADQYVQLFDCEQGQFSIGYSVIQIHYGRLTNADWKHFILIYYL